MRYSFLGVLVLLAVIAMAQQSPTGQPGPGQSPTGPTGGGTPTTLPTPETFPKDKGGAPPKSSPAEEQAKRDKIAHEIEKEIHSDSRLKGADVKATVEDNDIVMTGTVKNDQQRRLALHFAEAYSMGREIIDKLVASR